MRSITLPSLRIEPGLRRYGNVGLALILAVGSIAVPLSMLDGYLQRREEIAALRTDLVQLQARSTATMQTALAPSDSQEPASILAPNAEVAAAHIQTTLRGLAPALATEEIRIGSVRVLPPLTEGGAIAVRATASLTVPGSRVFDVVNAIEASTPPIVIDSLRVISRAEANGIPGRDRSRSETTRGELTIVMRAYARSAPEGSKMVKPRDNRAARDPRRP